MVPLSASLLRQQVLASDLAERMIEVGNVVLYAEPEVRILIEGAFPRLSVVSKDTVL